MTVENNLAKETTYTEGAYQYIGNHKISLALFVFGGLSIIKSAFNYNAFCRHQDKAVMFYNMLENYEGYIKASKAAKAAKILTIKNCNNILHKAIADMEDNAPDFTYAPVAIISAAIIGNRTDSEVGQYFQDGYGAMLNFIGINNETIE